MAEKFGITTIERPSMFMIMISGEINFKTILKVRPAVENAYMNRRNNILVDLSRVTNMDSAGVGLLTNMGKYLMNRRRKLGIISPVKNILELLEIASVDTFAELFDSLEEAEEELI